MRVSAVFAVLAILAPIGTAAQPVPKVKDTSLADCAALIASIPDIRLSPDTVVEDLEDGCRVTDIRVALDEIVDYAIAEATLLSPDLLRTFPTGEVFVAADLDLKGITIAPRTGSPLQDYLLGMNAIPLDLRLAYSSDPEALTSQATLDFRAGEMGRIGLSASLSDFDNADIDIAGYQDISGTLNRFTLTLEDDGMFASIFAPRILSMLPADEDPRPMITMAQETVVASLAQLSREIISEDSFVALSMLIRAFPQPEGKWTFDFESETGLSFSDVLNGQLPASMAMLADAKMTATAEPAPQRD